MFILNISRIFLSTHGNVDVIVGTAILLTILIGASILAASPKMRIVVARARHGRLRRRDDDVRLALARHRGTGRRSRHDPAGRRTRRATRSRSTSSNALMFDAGRRTGADRHREHHADERRRRAHVPLRRRQDAVRDARVSGGGRHGHGPRVLRRGRRLRLLLHDPGPPGGRHGGRDHDHRRDRHARRGRSGRRGAPAPARGAEGGEAGTGGEPAEPDPPRNRAPT